MSAKIGSGAGAGTGAGTGAGAGAGAGGRVGGVVFGGVLAGRGRRRRFWVTFVTVAGVTKSGVFDTVCRFAAVEGPATAVGATVVVGGAVVGDGPSYLTNEARWVSRKAGSWRWCLYCLINPCKNEGARKAANWAGFWRTLQFV